MASRNRKKLDEDLNGIFENLVKLGEEVERLEQEVVRLGGENSQLLAANQNLVARLRERINELTQTTATLEKVLEVLKALRRLPNSYAHFLNFVDQENKVADILYGGQRKRVGVDPEINASQLLLGTSVIMSGETSAVIGIDPNPEGMGNVVTLKRYISDNIALVESQHGDKATAYISNGVNKNEAVPNSKVLLNGNFVVGVVESAEDSIRRATNQYLLAEVPDVDFEDIGGLDEELHTIRTEIEDSFEVPRLYDIYTIPKESHVLLHGLPGNGKTMIAKAIAKVMLDKYRDRITPHASGNFFAVRGPELENKWVGETERMLREVVDSAASLAKRSESPVFVFFDDCEAFLLRRGAGISSDVNMGHVTQFTTLLEGIKEIRGVYFILATNRIDLIDPAVIRRMSLKMRIPEPNKDATTKIFRKLLRNAPLRGGQDLEHVVGTVVERLYRDSNENNFIEIVFQDDTSQVVKISQLVSGKIISDIVNKAKKIAKNRDKNLAESEWPTGISSEDLLEALEMEFKSNEGLPTTKEMILEWLKQKGITKAVDYTRKLFGEQLGERQIRHFVQ
ncbi:MAG: hypothetical protein A2655_04650 [Candidatus Yanofskybacteria bacterium RIFCSPHIGHO2_01_FULL_43_42]|uniref:AAA+ ATPase domain-containing protein n=1 Tax=Candidatus Yanofskybacteria bacterium RIFCSPLOWO2_01_FULL_43_22 TaxID=1802695 RepID=A0A1F8GGL3_9BACT|nr:MAG: hypothetical protein A2655_04650 [Candidatus Yanofskybacteria bacterium RIFCSPHIGHO2_01_FULL_43_42]OGN12807.1 MAG: hypothetical protein A3D48_00985 [Candidatus Yanofskybacteria bacterium RIFCSPHIGHO2_02_FULL_43_17]OGN23858.1 MAG: hypothetical protein A3A13_02085 [Candidatus Yanofskybacteria bacterium RIFCSPLOWO2_01_FULL_43_22]